jgi:hypothetical protein
MKILCIDPGETTGFAVLEDHRANLHQAMTRNVHDMMEELNKFYDLDLVIYENYLIYPNKVRMHTMKELVIPKLCGAIEAFCSMKDVDFITYRATDTHTGLDNMVHALNNGTKMKHEWRHASDALLLGLRYYLDCGTILENLKNIQICLCKQKLFEDD